ncbi:MAG TPA: beta-N-acetylhexosaminidase [Acidisarcina sp.]
MKGDELRCKSGSLMIVGIGGPELTTEERTWLKLVRPGGVILFRRNIETAEQTFHLLAEINKIIGADVFRCVDAEGGLVDRLRGSVAPMPSAAAVAAAGKPALYRRHGALIGRELRAFGFNTTFAPVLDLALPASRAVMRTRTASADPARVEAYARAFLEGLLSQKIIGCGKHFPGLGGGTLDSHEVTPAIDRTWDQMWAEDLLPYRSLARKLPMVMVSHAIYGVAVGDCAPASVSREWITDVLKVRLGYRGLVLSDDLEMGGILSHASIEEAAIGAVAAGTHLVEVCRDPLLVLRAYEALVKEEDSSASFRLLIEKAARKVLSFRRRWFSEVRAARAPTTRRIAAIRAQIRAFASLAPEPDTVLG